MKNFFAFQNEEIKKENFAKEIQEKGKGKFIPQMQSENVIIDFDLIRAIKVRSAKPTFVLMDNNISQRSYFYFKLRCQNEVGIGFCCPHTVQEQNFIFNEKERFRDCYLFKITPQVKNEVIFLKIFYDEQQQQLVLQNLSNNALTFINFSPTFNKLINPVVIFYDIGDNVQIIQEKEFQKQREEDLFDN